MNNQGYPIPITAKEVFTFLDQLMAYNGRTPDGMDKALVLEQVDGRAHSFFEAYPSLRYVTTDEDDEEADPKPLLVYDAACIAKVGFCRTPASCGAEAGCRPLEMALKLP